MRLRWAKEDKHQRRRAGGTLEPPGLGSVALAIREIGKINFGWRNAARGGVPIRLVRTFWGGGFTERAKNFPAWLSDQDGAVLFPGLFGGCSDLSIGPGDARVSALRSLP